MSIPFWRGGLPYPFLGGDNTVAFWQNGLPYEDITPIAINDLAATITGVGSVSANLSNIILLTSTITGVGSVSANLSFLRLLTASLTGTGSVAANLAVVSNARPKATITTDINIRGVPVAGPMPIAYIAAIYRYNAGLVPGMGDNKGIIEQFTEILHHGDDSSNIQT